MNECGNIEKYVDNVTSTGGHVYWEDLISDLLKERHKKVVNVFSSLSFSEIDFLCTASAEALVVARGRELEQVKKTLTALNAHQQLSLDERKDLFGDFISRMQEQQREIISPSVVSVAVAKSEPIVVGTNVVQDKMDKVKIERIAVKYPRGTLEDPTVSTSARVVLSKSINGSKDAKLARDYTNYLITTNPKITVPEVGDKVLTYFASYRPQSYYSVKSELKRDTITPLHNNPLDVSFKANHAYLVKPIKVESKADHRVSSLSDLGTLGIETISVKEAELNRQLREDDFVDEELLAEIDCQSKYIKG